MKMVSADKILSGKFVFKLVDSIGFPMDLIIVELRQRGMGFNVVEFIEAAFKSKNFSRKRLHRFFEEHCYGGPEAEEIRKFVKMYVDKIYGPEPEEGK